MKARQCETCKENKHNRGEDEELFSKDMVKWYCEEHKLW